MKKIIINQTDPDFATAEKYAAEHKKAFENWRYGEISEVWRDEDGILCIRYQEGEWWHYRINGPDLEWW